MHFFSSLSTYLNSQSFYFIRWQAAAAWTKFNCIHFPLTFKYWRRSCPIFEPFIMQNLPWHTCGWMDPHCSPHHFSDQNSWNLIALRCMTYHQVPKRGRDGQNTLGKYSIFISGLDFQGYYTTKGRKSTWWIQRKCRFFKKLTFYPCQNTFDF